MFERYTENARRATFSAREEATRAGASCVEPEHLLLGIMCSCEVEIEEAFGLKSLEDAFRAQIPAKGEGTTPSQSQFIKLSNQSKRSLAYAAEEAERHYSEGIGSGHLLLGVLRESESAASRFLVAHGVDLQKARQIVPTSSPPLPTGRSSRSPSGRTNVAKRRYLFGIAGPLGMIILLSLMVVKSAVTGRHLLVIAALWFVAALAWNTLGPSSSFLSLGKRIRPVATAIAYALAWLHQVFMFGWLMPLGVGIYRLTVR